jgi:hypothetical protein
MRSLENVGGGQAIQGVECFTIQGADFDFRRKSPGGDIMLGAAAAAASALSLRRRVNSQREARIVMNGPRRLGARRRRFLF